MAGWHHRLDGHEFEWTPDVGDGQGGLACCNSWGHKESDTTEQLNWPPCHWQPFPTLQVFGLFLPLLKVKVKVLVAQSCPSLCDPMDCSPPGSSVHGVLQVSILEWAAISFSRGSSQPKNQARVSWTAGRFFTIWATREWCLPSQFKVVNTSELFVITYIP